MKKHVLKTIYIIICITLITAFLGCSASKDSAAVSADSALSYAQENKELEKKEAEFRKIADSFEKNAEEAEKDMNDENPPQEEAFSEETKEESDKPSEENNAESKTETPHPEEASEYPVSNKCTITITCAEILDNMEKLDNSKTFSIPENGIILNSSEIEFEGGASAFDILLQAVKENGIHMEFSKTPGTNSVYIEAIANIYEFDCGELSGWMYTVNGEPAMVSSSDYNVIDGDRIEFIYVCSFFE